MPAFDASSWSKFSALPNIFDASDAACVGQCDIFLGVLRFDLFCDRVVSFLGVSNRECSQDNGQDAKRVLHRLRAERRKRIGLCGRFGFARRDVHYPRTAFTGDDLVALFYVKLNLLAELHITGTT